ncbi:MULTISPECIES: diacylglycerol kinase [unclassified Parvimonas]|uniref:diacylglycerol kinase n=1 Tax=unclassified Parvimonas TaxID=1151464 RepID=UPI001CB33D80|nr:MULTISPECIES: diacylglycerol kinase [unclassified Parvimonas]MBF1295718.1 diacylglycerol kinase [Parvimonas sp.]MEB3011495.1 diacylglycerol kinase [Parvimonas sp. D2]MEB3086987.1 diacylglycerol kinase [Parvimonas sp. D4]
MKKNSNFFESFLCAFRGIIYIFKTERNFRFHIVFSLLVLLSSLTLNLSYVELSVILIMIAVVLTLEIINTIIENIMDFLCKNYNFKVKIIKDMASGAVLVSAFISVIVGYLIFVPKILVIIGG